MESYPALVHLEQGGTRNPLLTEIYPHGTLFDCSNNIEHVQIWIRQDKLLTTIVYGRNKAEFTLMYSPDGNLYKAFLNFPAFLHRATSADSIKPEAIFKDHKRINMAATKMLQSDYHLGLEINPEAYTASIYQLLGNGRFITLAEFEMEDYPILIPIYEAPHLKDEEISIFAGVTKDSVQAGIGSQDDDTTIFREFSRLAIPVNFLSSTSAALIHAFLESVEPKD